MADAPIPSFDHVIEEGIALQRHLPSLDMVAVGGTAAALHAGHRYSTDVDHVTALLREQFDVVSDSLEHWVPTPEETLRIKVFMCTDRQATRDFVDVAALTEHIGIERATLALSYLNQIYAGVGNQSRLTRFAEVARQQPIDLDTVDLSSYRGIQPPYDEWEHVAHVCRQLADEMLALEMDRALPANLDGYADPAKLRGGGFRE